VHDLSFVLRFIKTNPGLISHHNVITFQMTGADACMRSLVLFHQLPTHPRCTNCGTRDYWLCLCLADIQFLCNLCDSDSYILQKHGSGFLQFHTASWCSGVPKHAASVTLVQPCFNNSLHFHFSKVNSTDPILRRWTCVNINTFIPFAHRTSYHSSLFFFGKNWKCCRHVPFMTATNTMTAWLRLSVYWHITQPVTV